MREVFLNLMAEYEHEFPNVERYLFVGGPKHGQRLEVIDTDTTFRVISPPAPAPFIADGGASAMAAGFDVHTYVKRDVGLQDDDATYFRAVFVHDKTPSPQVAQQLLSAALYVDFCRGGRRVVDENGRNTG
jgi:hypothetical protein